MLSISALYGGLGALLLVALSGLVIRERARARVSLGDGGDRRLEKAIRMQGNYVEYAPMGLLVIVLAEAQGAPALAVHTLGALLMTGRGLHAWGMMAARDLHPARGLGMVMTFAALALGGAGLLAHALIG